VDGRTLTRMRLAFVALGVALLLPLALLVRSASARLEEQRKLKHEVVAERIFDEMERELVALLERERARSSDAYAATNTRPETWAPFVVGYFVHDAAGARVTAGELLTDEREQSVAAAAQLAWGKSVSANRAPAAAGMDALLDEMLGPSPAQRSRANEVPEREPDAKPRAAKGGKATVDDDRLEPEPSQETVLRKLNRAQIKRRARVPKDDADKSSSKIGDDPLSGVDDL